MKTVNEVFPSAPIGARMAAQAFVVFGCLLGAAVVGPCVVLYHAKALPDSQTRVLLEVAPGVVLILVLLFFQRERARVAKIRIESDCLVFSRKRYPLTGLVSVARDPNILRWAVRLFGNGGLGAVRGRFWSRRVGAFEAFLTNSEQAVVLRWADRVVAVSPADPEYFIRCARTAAGLP